MASLGTVSFSRRDYFDMARSLGFPVIKSALFAARAKPMTLAFTTHSMKREGDRCVVEISGERV